LLPFLLRQEPKISSEYVVEYRGGSFLVPVPDSFLGEERLVDGCSRYEKFFVQSGPPLKLAILLPQLLQELEEVERCGELDLAFGQVDGRKLEAYSLESVSNVRNAKHRRDDRRDAAVPFLLCQTETNTQLL